MEQMKAINNVLSVDQFLKGQPGVNVNELLHYLIKVSVYATFFNAYSVAKVAGYLKNSTSQLDPRKRKTF